MGAVAGVRASTGLAWRNGIIAGQRGCGLEPGWADMASELLGYASYASQNAHVTENGASELLGYASYVSYAKVPSRRCAREGTFRRPCGPCRACRAVERLAAVRALSSLSSRRARAVEAEHVEPEAVEPSSWGLSSGARAAVEPEPVEPSSPSPSSCP